MKLQEFKHIDEIFTQLEDIKKCFYQELKVSESHFLLGRLYDYVYNIIASTEEVEIDLDLN